MSVSQTVVVGCGVTAAEHLLRLFESAGVTQEMQEEAVRAEVLRWASLMRGIGITPTIEGFVERNPQWQRPDMYDVIHEEILEVMSA